MGKKDTLLSGPKLTHIRNKNIEQNGLQSPLEQCSDAHRVQKTAWGVLH